MFETFIINAIIAGVGVAIVSGVMGCFVVWKKMAYFGDSLSHSTLLGVSLGLMFGVSTDLSVIIFCLIFTCILMYIKSKNILSIDTLLGVLSHAMLAIGIIAITFMQNKIDIYSYLFGDILTVTIDKIWLIYLCVGLVLFIVYLNWSSMVLVTIDESLAKAEKINVLLINFLIMLMITIVIALSIRVVGVLLISSMLVIPAASARFLTKSPISMAIVSAIIGVVSVFGGIYFSYIYDVPSGPAIIVFLAGLFIISFCFIKKNHNKNI